MGIGVSGEEKSSKEEGIGVIDCDEDWEEEEDRVVLRRKEGVDEEDDLALLRY